MKNLIAVFILLSFPTWSQSPFDNAVAFFNSQKYVQAQSIFENILVSHPNDVQTLEYLGDIESHLKKWDNAVPYYKKLIILKPSQAEYQYKYGGAMAMAAQQSSKLRALSMVGDIKMAFQKTIALKPDHIGARWALIEVYLQLPAIFGGSEEKALQYAEELRKISAVDGYLAKGHIEEYCHRYNSAEREYKKAIAAGNSITTYQKLADLYKNKMEQPEKARQLLAGFNKNKS